MRDRIFVRDNICATAFLGVCALINKYTQTRTEIVIYIRCRCVNYVIRSRPTVIHR